MKTYSYNKKIALSFLQARDQLEISLKNEGFGIITEIDMQAKLKEKIDVEIDQYIILGACNPPFAYHSLQEEQEVGLFLPCNLLVYKKGNGIWISTLLPTQALTITGNAGLQNIAQKIEEKLKKAIDNV